MRIHAIETGKVWVRKAQIVGEGHGLRRRLAPLFDDSWSDPLPVYAYAIEHPDGVILVDAGSNAGLMSLPKYHPYFLRCVRFDIDREQEVGPQLRALGIGPRDVKTIALTHLHIDHDGGLADFPAARVLAAPGEIHDASGLRGRIGGYLPQRWPLGFDPQPLVFEAAPFGPFASSRALTPDRSVIAIPTPGHTSNHLCYALKEENALFSGDHIMGWSTTVITPPDGDMTAYLASLERIAARNFTTLWPTHGPPIREVALFINAYAEHRRERMDQILLALAQGQATIGELTPRLYADVDSRLWPAAARSMLAAIIHLEHQGEVETNGPPGPDTVYRLAG